MEGLKKDLLEIGPAPTKGFEVLALRGGGRGARARVGSIQNKYCIAHAAQAAAH